jgi:hypothetical protein
VGKRNPNAKENVVKSNLKVRSGIKGGRLAQNHNVPGLAVIKRMTLVLAMTIATAAGCAHAGATEGQRRDMRGFARVGQEARAVLVGSARLVHATGDKPVRWFVAKQVQGDDRDCAAVASPVVLSESARARLSVGSGQVLCAAVASGATDVNWHEFAESNDGLWALAK